MKVEKFFCGFFIVSLSFFVELADASEKKVTVVVKEIGDMSESGDGYNFITKTGKSYYLYNAGGSKTIKGEEYIQESIDKKKPICLYLQGDGAVVVSSIAKGACKKNR